MNEDATLPEKGTPQSAGHDIFASTSSTIPPGNRKIIPTGLQIACQHGTYGRIAPRSGLTVKHGINVGAGVIDPDYRGEVGVVLFNDDAKETFHIEKGDKIAQLIVEKIDDTPLKPVTTLDATQRGTQGFGSTGDKKRTTPTASNRPDPPTQKKEGTTQNQTMESSTQPCMECTSKQCTNLHGQEAHHTRSKDVNVSNRDVAPKDGTYWIEEITRHSKMHKRNAINWTATPTL